MATKNIMSLKAMAQKVESLLGRRILNERDNQTAQAICYSVLCKEEELTLLQRDRLIEIYTKFFEK